MKQLLQKSTLICIILVCFFVPSSVWAKEYSYERINVDIHVKSDSTITVKEFQVFNYSGTFTKGWRYIPFKKIDDITDIKVYEGSTGELLEYVSTQLNQYDENSWGKYTTYRENGGQVIEWYYNETDSQKTWVLEYTVHGAIGFYKDFDEVYWNVFTEYEVPVKDSTVQVILPFSVGKDSTQAAVYTTDDRNSSFKILDDRAIFLGSDFPPQADFTVAFGFPKGIVDESMYWEWWFFHYIGYLASGATLLLLIFTCAIYWYVTEKYNKGRGTIVPIYEPPHNLKPAMAEVIVKENISEKTWPATIVDLAVRGYLKIEEDTKEKHISLRIVQVVAVLILLGLTIQFISFLTLISLGWITVVILIPVIFLITATFRTLKTYYGKDYNIIPTEKYITYSGTGLEEYEYRFLQTIFHNAFTNSEKVFSTRDMKYSRRREDFSGWLKEVKKNLFEEIDEDIKVYENKLQKDRYLKGGMFVMTMIYVVVAGGLRFNQVTFFLSTLIYSIIIMSLFAKYEARLSHEGHILREEILGFKLYLKTAEKYRMQNLTPEIFEKYLPYAIVFGIEKKWAKAFETMNLESPQWHTSSGISSGSFSVGAFSSALSSSFASSFASSGGSAGSGGGGGAGGGGGGGGGGAS